MPTIRFRIAFLSIITCLALGASWQLSQAQEDLSTEPDTTAVTAWSPPGTAITTSALNADAPRVSTSPTSNEIIIVFNGWTSDESIRDPYFVRSTDNGATWSSAATIATNNSTRATTHVTHDTAGNAHAVWIDYNTGTLQYTVEYGYKTSNGTSWTTKNLIASTFGTGITNAVIAARDSSTIDIVFEGAISGGDPNPTLWHIRSTNGGTSWGAATRINGSSSNPSTHPSLTYDSAGRLHVAWEQQTPTLGSDIYYSRYDSNSWSGALILSGSPVVNNDARKPSIEFGNNSIYVAYSHGRSTNTDRLQTVYGVICSQTSNTCENADHWSDLANFSSQAVEVNEDNPFYVIPELAFDTASSEMQLFLHGAAPGSASGNELLWKNDTCNNWTAMDSITTSSAKSISPRVDIESGLMHLVYENVGNEQIYYMQDQFDNCQSQAGLIHYLAFFTK